MLEPRITLRGKGLKRLKMMEDINVKAYNLSPDVTLSIDVDFYFYRCDFSSPLSKPVLDKKYMKSHDFKNLSKIGN